MTDRNQNHDRESRFATSIQHAGSEFRVGTGLVSATEISATFQTASVNDEPVYQRLSNTQNHKEVQAVIAALHGAERAGVYASGMAAMSALAFTVLRPGDHVIAQENCYGGNQGLLVKVLPLFGVTHTFAKIEDWDKHITQQTKLAYFETISNPFCVPQNLKLAVEIAKAHKLLTVCDNTFASPVNCQPLKAGVDYVLESATKYLNGHSDLICGVLASSKVNMEAVDVVAMYLGGFLATPGCAQLLRGVRTLKVRMDAHNKNGHEFAGQMRESGLADEVYYGLGSAQKSMPCDHLKGFGGMCTVRFKAKVKVPKMMRAFSLIRDVPSLGGTETSATMPFHTTNGWMAPSKKRELGIDEQLVRFSVGLEDVADLVADIKRAAEASLSL